MFEDIAIGITTFNRPEMITRQAISLAACENINRVKIVVVDDASSFSDEESLSECYPGHSDIKKSEVNSGGADFACKILIEELIATGKAILVLLDSDLIVHQDMVAAVLRLAPRSKGFFSLYNSTAHLGVPYDGDFLLKQSVGAAGIVMTSAIAKEIVSNVEAGLSFDWRMGDWLKSAGIPILVSRDSFVQHIGFVDGQNCVPSTGDFGTRFFDYSPANTAAINESLIQGIYSGFSEVNRQIAETQEHTRRQADRLDYVNERLEYIHRSLSWRLTAPFRDIFAKIKKQ